MEEQDTIPYHLTDEQVAEVSRRRADFAACKERYASDEDELLRGSHVSRPLALPNRRP